MSETQTILKALSVRQPWAWAIIHGGKDIENRSEGFAERIGRRVVGQTIFVHAGKAMTTAEYDWAARFMSGIGVDCPPSSRLQRGGVIGTVRVVEIVSKSKSPWFGGPCGLVLADPKPCKFVPARGQLGLFSITPLSGS